MEYLSQSQKGIVQMDLAFSGKRITIELNDKELGMDSDHPHSGIIVELSLKIGARLVVATTHLKAGKRWESQRVIQAVILLKMLSNFLNGESKPFIIAADLNSQPSKSVYQLFQKGKAISVIDGQSKEFTQPFTIKSVYSHLPGRDILDALFTLYDGHGPDTFDYIWFSASLFQVLKILDMPAQETIKHFGALPCQVYPSDHLALYAELQLLNVVNFEK